MDRVDMFLEEYKALEEAVRRVYRLSREQSVIGELKRQNRFEELKPQIQSLADLRNYYAHNTMIGGDFAAEPTEAAFAFLRELTAMVNSRPKCRDICVKKKDIIWRAPDDLVLPALKLMQEHGHSCLPILTDGVCTGVFDERALFAYAAEAGGDLFRGGRLTFRDLDPYVSISRRNILVYAFASMNAYADAAQELFEKKLDRGKRLRLILLTAGGQPGEKLQGILTPWDLLEHNV